MTCSGYGLLIPITDQEALVIQPNDTVLVTSPTGLKPLQVVKQRFGVAEDSEGMPYEVPIFDGQIYGGPVLAYAIPDCYQVEIIQL